MLEGCRKGPGGGGACGGLLDHDTRLDSYRSNDAGENLGKPLHLSCLVVEVIWRSLLLICCVLVFLHHTDKVTGVLKAVSLRWQLVDLVLLTYLLTEIFFCFV